MGLRAVQPGFTRMRNPATGGVADLPERQAGYYAGRGWEPYEEPEAPAKPKSATKKGAGRRKPPTSSTNPPPDSASADDPHTEE